MGRCAAGSRARPSERPEKARLRPYRRALEGSCQVRSIASQPSSGAYRQEGPARAWRGGKACEHARRFRYGSDFARLGPDKGHPARRRDNHRRHHLRSGRMPAPSRGKEDIRPKLRPRVNRAARKPDALDLLEAGWTWLDRNRMRTAVSSPLDPTAAHFAYRLSSGQERTAACSPSSPTRACAIALQNACEARCAQLAPGKLRC